LKIKLVQLIIFKVKQVCNKNKSNINKKKLNNFHSNIRLNFHKDTNNCSLMLKSRLLELKLMISVVLNKEA